MRAIVPLGIAGLLILCSGCGDDESCQPCADGTPPAAVTDLRVSERTLETARLTWTAPGDDGQLGQAAAYDMRTATHPLLAEHWDAATVVPIGRAPRPAGQAETLTVAQLADSTYYFALKAADEVPQWSPLSNIVAAEYEDAIPPAAVTDLAVAHVTTTAIELRWTSTGDDSLTGWVVDWCE